MNKREFAESMKGGYKLLLPRTDLELGYIKGYRWGVEYPTNGKKPDLPDTILVDVRSSRMKDWHIKSPQEVGGWQWGDLGSGLFFEFFRIVDQHYKPVDTSYLSVSEIPESKSNAENVSDWYDYEAQKAVALPPVGEKVEVFLHWSESWSGWVVIVGHDHDGVIWRSGSDNKSYIYSPKDEIRPLDNATRKAEAEKHRVTGAALQAYMEIQSRTRNAVASFDELYDLGYLRTPSK